VFSFLVLPSCTVYAATQNESFKTSNLASTQWVTLGSGKQNCGASITAVSIGFSLYATFIPGGYSVTVPTAIFSNLLAIASLKDSYVVYTQYRSAGQITSTTLLKTVSSYYANGKFVGTTTNTVTLGSIFNTYSDKN